MKTIQLIFASLFFILVTSWFAMHILTGDISSLKGYLVTCFFVFAAFMIVKISVTDILNDD